jgi:hypothetical protein
MRNWHEPRAAVQRREPGSVAGARSRELEERFVRMGLLRAGIYEPPSPRKERVKKRLHRRQLSHVEAMWTLVGGQIVKLERQPLTWPKERLASWANWAQTVLNPMLHSNGSRLRFR